MKYHPDCYELGTKNKITQVIQENIFSCQCLSQLTHGKMVMPPTKEKYRQIKLLLICFFVQIS